MTQEANKLIRTVNDLQAIVSAMFALYDENCLQFRFFLNELHDEDYRQLADLRTSGKLGYLHVRFQSHLAQGMPGVSRT
jgi:hypothetical protein